MQDDPSSGPKEDQEPDAILRDADLVVLEGYPDAQRAATWVCGILRSLENLARLPDAEDEAQSGIKKAARLKMQLERLFGYLASPLDCEIIEADRSRFGILAFTESSKQVSLGPISGSSACYATVYLATALLLCLDGRSPTTGIPPLRRIPSSSQTALRPRVRDEQDCDNVLEWLRHQLPVACLEGVHDRLIAEVRHAARLASGLAARRDDPHLEGLRKVALVLDQNGDLDLDSQLLLIALYEGRDIWGDGEMVQETIAAQIRGSKKRLGLQPVCRRTRVAERFPGLKMLGYIEQPKYKQARLTEQGRAWVQDAELYERLRAS